MKVLIIGGVAGGATTAARLRRLDESAEIRIYERGAYISYANCGLPYYIGGTIAERDRLFVQTPESFTELLNVDVKVKHDVISINRDRKTLSVRNLDTDEVFEDPYDKLVLSPGAEPLRPGIPGIDSDKIFTLRNVPDTDHIKTFVDANKPRRAVIIGAGFIGLEMAENLHQLGIFVTIVEAAEQVMNILDYEMAAEVHQHLKVKGVEFYLKDGVSSFTDKGDSVHIALQSSRVIEADLVILSIGVKPDVKLAVESGLEIGTTGGIKIDSHLMTNDKDIYALGDATEYPNPITGDPLRVPLAGPANKQGRMVADNIIMGNKRSYRGTIATGIAKVFDLTVASTGLSEKQLLRMDREYQRLIIHATSHAGYYPDADPMTIKIIFNKERQLLGAQIVGYSGVDKRIDLFAVILGHAGTIDDLQEIEHAYAPPFSSAKDPVNIAGFVAENILNGSSHHLHWNEMNDIPREERILIDVRTEDEYGIETLDGAVNIPLPQIRNRIAEIPKDKKVILFCGVGKRAYMAERILRQNGLEDVYNLSGGMKTYSLSTQQQSNEDIFEKDFIGHDDNIYQSDPHIHTVIGDIKTIEVDACGLQCPGPVLKLKEEMEALKPGEMIQETATDPGFARDVYAWAKMTGNSVVSVDQKGPKVIAVLKKGGAPTPSRMGGGPQKGTSLILFSDDLDKALAAMVIANGAISAGKEVTLFFTFWGLSFLKKAKAPRVKKDFMGKMFAMMLPSSSRKMGLSKINMGGMGARMMRMRMKALGVDSVEQMMETALKSGIRLVACQMSMDVMGVAEEELIDGVEIGGVASFLGAADDSQTNMFI
ncbi:CoA-disulfide reductase [Oceanispirochaeta crateris]|uniref:CoA-disulfide reductase n=1 Tax=Oceanispirochaeta crateris TaxID=2518645 RepID=A0A5C1QEI8_9SPIO|nr:CoA-disulfide reductase [Oceanispirochaeta crateris]QEN06473.1 CoA-disulfide reductase [Oceanispirochaeta crateris]